MSATSAPARGDLRPAAGHGIPVTRRRRRLPFSPWHLVLIPATIALIFPFAWLLVTSVETPSETLHFPPVLFPHDIRFADYPDALASAPFVRFFIHSAVVAVATVLCNLAALTFLDSWNNFLWPLIAVTSTNQMTLPLGLATFQGAHATEWNLLMAANVMSLVPMLAVFFIAQRYFIRSVAATGLAGT